MLQQWAGDVYYKRGYVFIHMKTSQHWCASSDMTWWDSAELCLMYHKLFRVIWLRIAKWCIVVYWRACRWYDWTGFNSAKLLSSTTNINVARVDNLPPKLMHKLFRDALCIHVSVDGYFWSGFNNVELSTVATLIAPYGGIWQVGLKKTDNNIWFCNGWQDFVEYHSICYVIF